MPPKQDTLPKNWPPILPYLRAPSYSKSLTPTYLSALRTKPQDIPVIPTNTPRGPCQLVRITPITSPSHPTNGQSGLFATRDLKPATFILQYIGEIHATPSNSDPDPHAESNYDLSLDREHGIGIDADKRGNEARFINDYRGVAERPNAEFREVWDERRKERGMGVWVLPEGKSGKGRGIRRGEEILVSYGRGFWGARREGEV
ncbi:SET domain-containing protein [Mollisia scopiformis]|uniref:SET domain-containing protein n=1 Tax=Mollisia scopiformis TaxID=149040 RepID=A0A194XSQ3_MOLSC|nr:SET domain-containing protein [Mollisia scopiformis]KUJ23069.1 SET domain-containing protein [Mollisia scopiformis]